jgi:hypothetical protein
MSAGATSTIRNMSPQVSIGFPAGATGYFNATFAGPDGGQVRIPMSCYIVGDALSSTPDFRGNGNYTITITNFAKGDSSCTKPTSTETYVYAINSSVGVTQPPAPFLIRAPNSFHTNTLSLPVQGNPGASGYDVQYALNATLNPDGSIAGTPQSGYVNSTTNTIDLNLNAPGTWTVVARAKSLGYASPWSAPAKIQAIVPFDLDGLTFPDPRGPKYSLKGTVRDKSIRGTVSLALARGSKGGKYKSIGKVKISSKSTFTKHFTQHRYGTYRLRVHYAGGPLAAPVSYVIKFRITKHIYYR